MNVQSSTEFRKKKKKTSFFLIYIRKIYFRYEYLKYSLRYLKREE